MTMIAFVSKVAALCCMVALTACDDRRSADEAAVTDTLMRLFDKPEARLVVGPIAVAGNAALADWTQGALGGRALLKRHADAWGVVLCAGDGIKNESALSMAGIPSEHAREIVAELSKKERSESAERLQLIASFRGVVRMEGGSHPPANDAHGAHEPQAEPGHH